MKSIAIPCLAAALVLPVVSAAQEDQASTAGSPSDSQVFVESVAVEVINVDVYVTDKSGRPVTGLTQDDFLLFVDGRPVAISNFYAVSEDVAEEVVEQTDTEDPESAVEPDQAEHPTETEPEPSATPPDQRLHFVVYIDNYNLTQFNRNRVLRELREFLRRELSREDQVMLVSYDRSLHIRQPFTYSPERVSQALLELEDISAQRIHRDRERTDLIAAINDAEADDADLAIQQLRHYAGSVFNDMNFTIDALSNIVDNLAGSPGRKAVVYVSDGVPMIAAEDIFHFVNQMYERRMSLNSMTEYDLSRRFSELAAKANANRVTFYTIDARGLRVGSQGTVDPANEGAPGQMQYIDSILTSNLQSPLQMMAEETGGRAIINTNRFMPDLLRMKSDFRNYYSLGYQPAELGDGRYHRIEVKLQNKARGMQLRHRTGYRNKTLESRMIDGTLSALNLNMQDNPLNARIAFGRPVPRADGNYDAVVAVQLPFEKITLLPRAGVNQGRLRIYLAARDEEDRATEVQSLPVAIDIPDDRMTETEGKLYTYQIPLMMEGGHHYVGVGILDELGARHAFLRRGIDPSRP